MSQAPIHSCLERQRPLLKDLKYCIFEENCPCCYILSHWIDSIPGVKRWSCTANYDQKRQQAPIGNCWFSSWKPRWSTEEAATTTSCRWAIRYVGHSSQQSHCVLAARALADMQKFKMYQGFDAVLFCGLLQAFKLHHDKHSHPFNTTIIRSSTCCQVSET